MLYRCHEDGSSPLPASYSLPYSECVGDDPGLEDMHKVVCVEGRRPVLPSSSSAENAAVCRAAAECWYDAPAARLTAFRVKKSLSGALRERERRRNEDDNDDRISKVVV